MKVIRSALLPYSADAMYRIVADINAYPQFLKWCDSVSILEQDAHKTVAKLHLKYAGLNIYFTTCNRNHPGESIGLELVDGPFSALQGEWRFEALSPQACKVSVEMHFQFDNSIASAVMGPVFKQAISQQLEAFVQRADKLYGARNNGSADA